MTKEEMLEPLIFKTVHLEKDVVHKHDAIRAMQQYADQECAEKDKEIRLLSEQRKHWANTAIKRQEVIEAQDKRIKELEEETNEYSRNLKNCVDHGSKLVNDILQQSKEVERLKGLIEKLVRPMFAYLADPEQIEILWQQFKRGNNL